MGETLALLQDKRVYTGCTEVLCSVEGDLQGCSLTGLTSRLLTGVLRLRVPLAPVAGLGVMSSHRRVPRVNEWLRVVAPSCMRPLSLDNSFPV